MENTKTLNNFFNKKALKGTNLSERSKVAYTGILNQFSEANNKTLQTLLQEAKEDQTPYLNNRNQIIMPDIDSSRLSEQVTHFIETQKQQKNQPQTINDKLSKIKSFFKFNKLEFPNFKLQTEKQTVKILSKEQIGEILKNMSTKQRAMYGFLLATGMRISDMVKLTIEDFMEAIGVDDIKYLIHTEVNNVGYWEFVPQKTRNSSGVTCMTCSTPEANNNIISYLRKRNRKTKLALDQPLFMTNRGNAYDAQIFSTLSYRESQRIKKDMIKGYERDLEDGKISKRKYDELVEKTPKFHPHGLRKYFISVLANQRVPSRISAVMEGHVPPIATDDHYVKISKEAVIEEYTKIVPYLSFENVEVRTLDVKNYTEMEDRIKHLEMLLSQRS